MHRSIKPGPHHLRYATRVIAVRLVDLCLQHRPHVPRLNADHRQARFGENAINRDSPDDSQTGINVRVSPALLQDRREVLTATSTSGNLNAWSRVWSVHC